MNAINKMNYLFMLLPITLGILGLINDLFYSYSLFSLIPLGLFQIGVAIFFNSELNDIFHFKIYSYGVMLFFSLAFTAKFWWDYLEPFSGILYDLPPSLAIYFSIILYNKSKKT